MVHELDVIPQTLRDQQRWVAWKTQPAQTVTQLRKDSSLRCRGGKLPATNIVYQLRVMPSEQEFRSSSREESMRRLAELRKIHGPNVEIQIRVFRAASLSSPEDRDPLHHIGE
jgi:hypothetical protein